MSKSGKPIIYWDTNVWIAIIGEETTNPIYEGSMYAMERVAKSEVELVLSEFVRLELVKTNLNPKSEENFSNVLKRSNVEKLSISSKIVNIASDLQKEAARAIKGKVLKTVDAVHLATAIYSKADELYVADGDLLTLDGKLKMYNAPKISCPPLKPQMDLPLFQK